MGCFCSQAIALSCQEQLSLPGAAASAGVALSGSLQATAALALSEPAQLIAAISQFLALRWLPAPAPWQPDPAWLELDLAPPPLPAAALAVITAMVQAAMQARAVLGLDLTAAADVRALARIVATLNLRTGALGALAADPRPWTALAALNEQADAVRSAAQAGLFAAAPAPASAPSLAPWRTLLAQIKALAPLIAIGQMLKLDFTSPHAFVALAEQIRLLAAITLPALSAPLAVGQVIARANAIARLSLSFGANPLVVPFAKVAAAVQLKIDAVLALLPPTVEMGPLGLTGMIDLPPNPGVLAPAAVVAAAMRIPPTALAWSVPAFADVALLVSGNAAISLAGLLGPGIVVAAPCPVCDAQAAVRAAL